MASVAEEGQNPDRNLPLGMFLSLATATAIYCVGVFIMIAVLDPSELRSDLTPVATAAEKFFTWLPEPWGLGLIVAAAIAAFAAEVAGWDAGYRLTVGKGVAAGELGGLEAQSDSVLLAAGAVP